MGFMSEFKYKVIIIKIIGYTWSSKNVLSEGKSVHSLADARGEGPLSLLNGNNVHLPRGFANGIPRFSLWTANLVPMYGNKLSP